MEKALGAFMVTGRGAQSSAIDLTLLLEGTKAILEAFLHEQHRAGKTVVLILDEAQSISAPNMHTLHILTNMQTAKSKLLQICLFAQPSMDRKLSYQPALRSRIARRGTLNALVYEDAEGLLRHRIEVAGGDFDALFDSRALRLLYEASKGIPRDLCILADNALFQAYSGDKRRVDAIDAETAICATKGKA